MDEKQEFSLDDILKEFGDAPAKEEPAEEAPEEQPEDQLDVYHR